MNSLISPMILENNGTVAEAMLIGVGVLTFSLVIVININYRFVVYVSSIWIGRVIEEKSNLSY